MIKTATILYKYEPKTAQIISRYDPTSAIVEDSNEAPQDFIKVSIAGHSSVSSNIKGEGKISASLHGSSSLNASLGIQTSDGLLSVNIVQSGSLSSDIKGQGRLVSSISAGANVSASIKAEAALAVSIQGHSSLNIPLMGLGGNDISISISCVASVSTSISATGGLTANIAAGASGSIGLKGNGSLSASISGVGAIGSISLRGNGSLSTSISGAGSTSLDVKAIGIISTSISGSSSISASIANGSGGSSYDSDAQAVIDAIQLTDTLTTGQKDAINYRITQMKTRGTWTKRKAYYGFVGGTADAHKWNWKDPRDLDAAFRLTFVGSPTHSANGVEWNGTSQYANTHLVPSSVLTVYHTHALYYSLADSDGFMTEMGCYDDSTAYRINIHGKFSGSTYYDMYSPSGIGRLVVAGVRSDGYIGMIRSSNTDLRGYRQGTQTGLLTGDPETAGLPAQPIYIGAFNFGGGAAFYSSRPGASASFGDDFTPTEMSDDAADEQTFQTMLSRQV